MKKKVAQKKHRPYPKSKLVDESKMIQVFNGERSEDYIDHIWVTIEGEQVFFRDLRESHIHNILHFMNNRPGWRAEQRPLLEQELLRREQKRLAKKTKAGKLFYGSDN